MKGSGGGEIVQVQGGHIIRATGRKDRHSKVFTAKGPRDRRVRLSAHTAIEFYDVQDRLGYDRPSKAVDWLIKKAKSAIDKLAELPPFDPSASAAGVGANSSDVNMMEPGLDMAMADHSESSDYAIHLQRHLHGDTSPGGNGSNDAYVPQPIDLSPTMKPFFPVNTNPSVADGNSINFHDYGHLDMGSHTQDLCLSLHSFQDPSLIHGHQESDHHAPNSSHQHPHSSAHDHHTTLLSPSAAMAGFDPNSGGWGNQHPSDNGRYMRLVGWNNIASSDGNAEHNRGAAGGASFIYPSPLIQEQQQAAYLGQFGPYSLSERGTLQSTNNYTQMARSWDEDIHAVGRHEDHRKGHQMILHPSMTASFVAASACDGFTGFCFPSTGVGSHHGGEEFNGVVPNKASSAMSPKSSH